MIDVTISKETLTALFASISPSPALGPLRPFGNTDEATRTVLQLLKDNHARWHIFFNDIGFHNHATHHLLAIYALGAPGPLLESAYGSHSSYQRKMFGEPIIITEENFTEYLGVKKYYLPYLRFFSDQLLKKDASVGAILEKYVFSELYNFGSNDAGMLDRFMALILHALIHVGNGIEFGIKGLIAEGLAEMAANQKEAPALYPRDFFENFVEKPGSETRSKEASHLFAIVAKIAEDKRLTQASLGLKLESNPHEILQNFSRVASQASVICEYVNMWDLTGVGHDERVLEERLEELLWLQAILYGVCGVVEGKAYNADFFTLHLATSALFLPSIIAVLTPRSQRTLLRAFLAYAIAWWVERARPEINIKLFYEKTTAFPAPPKLAKRDTEGWFAPEGVPAGCANPWLNILDTALVHPNEHLPKIIRSLAYFAERYGHRPRGYFANSGLDGAEELDGTVFVRIAGLTLDRVQWAGEGPPFRHWDRHGFFEGAAPSTHEFDFTKMNETTL